MKKFHLSPREDDWELTEEGRANPVASFDSKRDALKHTIPLVARKTGSLKIHKADGTIEEERTYPRAADPVETPG